MTTPDPQKTNELMEKLYDKIEKQHPVWTPDQIANEVTRILEEALMGDPQ